MIRRPRRNQDPRRGSVLLVVMLVITMSALATATVLYRADAQRGGASVMLDETRLRALAWSGVQAAMSELASQREGLLDGGQPRLTRSWDLFTEGGRVGRVRLVTIASGQGEATPEGSKLDLNTASAEMLAKLPGVGAELGARLVSARGAGFGSVEEVADLEGMSVDVLYGPRADDQAPVATAGAPSGTATGGLLDHVTTFSFDPDRQVGIGPGGEGSRGQPRLNLRGGWSDDLKEAVASRLGAPQAERAAAAFKGAALSTDAEMLAAMQRAGVDVEEWGAWLDVFSTGEDEYRLGRVDVNSAPASVLACIPGISAEAAEKIVMARESLDADARRSAAWLVTQKVLTPESFVQAADWITARSLQWRVRVVAAMEDASADDMGISGAGEAEVRPLRSVVWEAVVDVSEERPRVAYLRDVTHLDLALLVVEEERRRAQERGSEENLPAAEASEEAPNAAEDAGVTEDSAPADQPGTMEPEELEIDTDLDFGGGLEREAPGAEVNPPAPTTEESSTGVTMKDRRIGRWRGGGRGT